MKYIVNYKLILAVLMITALNYAQELDVKITADKTEIKNSSFSKNMDDHLKIKYELLNNSRDTVLVKFEPYFDTEFIQGESNGPGYCFRLIPIDSNGESNRYKYNSYESFKKLAPGEITVNENFFTVIWLCRSMPPAGDWNFDIKYHTVLIEETNFYLVNSRYTDFTSKEYIKAWTGELKSNTIKLKVIR
jgi:hypothetical protein